jgi:p-aminobenzoyl-glutamate transporter AbgT
MAKKIPQKITIFFMFLVLLLWKTKFTMFRNFATKKKKTKKQKNASEFGWCVKERVWVWVWVMGMVNLLCEFGVWGSVLVCDGDVFFIILWV